MKLVSQMLARRVALMAALLCLLAGTALTGCASSDATTVTIATFFPTSGVDGALGKAMQNAVDLAVAQHGSIGSGYALNVEHVDALNSDGGATARAFVGDPSVMGIVGPLDSAAALGMLPVVAQASLVTISPGATLPGLTLADAATAEKLPFDQLHPKGAPIAFLRQPQNDSAMGKVAADLAVGPTSSHGLNAKNVSVIDDGTASGKAAAAAFATELAAKGGAVMGQGSVLAGSSVSAQTAVAVIVDAFPDAVFYAGNSEAGAELRGALTLSGAALPMIVAGPGAGDPSWSAMVGLAAAAANTSAILPAPDLTKLDSAKDFVTAYAAAYANQTPPAMAALAYDAAMDEIAGIQSVIASGKTLTRAAVLSAVASAQYKGVTGTLAFDKNGDNTTALGFSLYTCDNKGVWHFVGALKS